MSKVFTKPPDYSAKGKVGSDPKHRLCPGCGAVIGEDGFCGHGQNCPERVGGPVERRYLGVNHTVSRTGAGGASELVCKGRVIDVSVDRIPKFDLVCPLCGVRVIAGMDRRNNFVLVEYKKLEDGGLERIVG